MPKNCTAVVIGATGATGAAIAEFLVGKVRRIVLVGRDEHDPRLETLAIRMIHRSARVRIRQQDEALPKGDIIFTATSSDNLNIKPEHLKRGAVVVIVSRPRDVGQRIAQVRPDVMVLDGGNVMVPGEDPDLGFDFGFPSGIAYGCMAETLIQIFDGAQVHLTLGDCLKSEDLDYMAERLDFHGFRPAGWRSFDRVVTDVDIKRFMKEANLSWWTNSTCR